MAKLVLIRHTQSQWNEKGLWTGLTDIPLSTKGEGEAKQIAPLIRDIAFDTVFTSPLQRAKQTWRIIKDTLGISPKEYENSALNERDYGKYTGQNKWEIQKKLGGEKFLKIRRGWNEPIPQGETLQDVYHRVIPFYKKAVEPLLKKGDNILIVAHGNSLRSLVKYLDHVSDLDIEHIELKTGEVWEYDINEAGAVTNKKILN